MIFIESDMMLFLSLMVLLLASRISPSNSISYSVPGTWTKATKTTAECKMFMCSPFQSYTWNSTYENYRLYNNVTACSELTELGVKKIDFYGDSYMRHIYAAVLITLNGDYASGSLEYPEKHVECRYHTLFKEKVCNLEALKRKAVVCDGRLVLDATTITHESSPFTTKECAAENGTVALWSFGNHPLKKPGRHGVNNPAAYQQHFSHTICPTLLSHKHEYTGRIGPQDRCSIWWVSTHHRLFARYRDESPETVESYNVGMRSFLESGACGNVNYIDVFNMTKAISDISQTHKLEPSRLSWDQTHWGLEVNLIKAQIVINALLHSIHENT